MTDKPLTIFGAGGQVGRALSQIAMAGGLPVRALTRQDCDIASADAVARAVAGSGFVVNCAAYTAVDKAESEPDLAHAINAVAPGIMAQACHGEGIPLLHISTDYVFDGAGDRPWREEDPIAPLNVYGRTKADGEAAVRAATPHHLILRTAWVYDSEGKNFVLTMLRLGAEREELKIVADQKGGPTSAEDIARAILSMIEEAGKSGFAGWGIYHFSGGPPTSWFDFAAAIFAGKDKPQLLPITTSEYPTPAKRPANSVLDCNKIQTMFGIEQPDWRRSLAKVLSDISER